MNGADSPQVSSSTCWKMWCFFLKKTRLTNSSSSPKMMLWKTFYPFHVAMVPLFHGRNACFFFEALDSRWRRLFHHARTGKGMPFSLGDAGFCRRLGGEVNKDDQISPPKQKRLYPLEVTNSKFTPENRPNPQRHNSSSNLFSGVSPWSTARCWRGSIFGYLHLKKMANLWDRPFEFWWGFKCVRPAPVRRSVTVLHSTNSERCNSLKVKPVVPGT